MANPTTYFGWVMPNSADLVTDLPADFNVFGQGVDTSMQFLLGGTTGQILSKTSATNMAFTWINNDQGDITGVTAGTGISVTSPTGPVPTVAIDGTVATLTGTQTFTNKTLTSPALTTPTISTLTTNGDLLYGTGSGALSRLGIGSTSQVLTVTGGVPVWATPAGGGGKVLQVVQATTTTATTTSSTSYQNTSLSASITPTLNTSKVLVIAMQTASVQASDRRCMNTLFRGTVSGTDLSSGTTDGLATSSNQTGGSSNQPFSMQFLDSPATTSSTTYTAAIKTDGGGQCAIRGSTMQVMILMEIGA